MQGIYTKIHNEVKIRRQNLSLTFVWLTQPLQTQCSDWHDGSTLLLLIRLEDYCHIPIIRLIVSQRA
jgi:hypothetical protein